MSEMLKEFATAAQNLSKNPLGIIALFIVLVYGMACLVVGAVGSLAPSDRTLIVYFLILFPVLVFCGFLRLVMAHHTKLYSPRDFKDEKNFFFGLDERAKEVKLRADVAHLAEILREMAPQFQVRVDTLEARVDAHAAALVQRSESISVGLPEVPRPELLYKLYARAEDLVLSALDREFGRRIDRSVGVLRGGDWGFDGHVLLGDLHLLVEVKYTRGADEKILRQVVRDEARRVTDMRAGAGSNWPPSSSVMLCIVLHEARVGRLEAQQALLEAVKEFPLPAQLRIFEFDTLNEEATGGSAPTNHRQPGASLSR